MGWRTLGCPVLDDVLRTDHGITDGDKIVMVAASRHIAVANGSEDALEALPQIQESVRAALMSDGGDGRVKLVFVGDEPIRPLATGNVLFPGFLPPEQASRLAGVADLGLLPSLSEASDPTAVEFAAAGLLMVLTTSSEFAESDDLALRIPRGNPDALASAVHAALTDPVASGNGPPRHDPRLWDSTTCGRRSSSTTA
ncbi:glycosyltransferase [Tenggerimyces flavus]|uniref:Glycosyltransferase n=1 Tax=Tenggerimyces flavus TaxID=1708749 RepID=A0ABV7YL45_9ACTN|nr:glycosyltransferase [Tenggerimyces flavus]